MKDPVVLVVRGSHIVRLVSNAIVLTVFVLFVSAPRPALVCQKHARWINVLNDTASLQWQISASVRASCDEEFEPQCNGRLTFSQCNYRITFDRRQQVSSARRLLVVSVTIHITRLLPLKILIHHSPGRPPRSSPKTLRDEKNSPAL